MSDSAPMVTLSSTSARVSIIWEWVLLIISLFFFGFSIANAVYYSKIKSLPQVPTPPVTKGAANVMMWFNIILTIIAALLAIFIVIRLVLYRHDVMTQQTMKKMEKQKERERKTSRGEDCSGEDDPKKQSQCKLNRRSIQEKRCGNLDSEGREYCEKVNAI